MPFIQPLAEDVASDKTAQTYERLREMFGTDTVPEPFLPMGRVPAFLGDYYMNFKKFVYQPGKLDATSKAIVGLAVSAHFGSDVWTRFFSDRLRSIVPPETDHPQLVADVIAITATCGMYNTFFKFRDIAGGVFEGMSVGLRAHAFAGTTLNDRLVELINIVISDLNACKPCVTGHIEKARKLGISDEEMMEAIQAAATVAAGARFTLNAAL